MVDTKVKLCGIALDNPVIPASGTFGYGSEYAELYDINCLGSFSFKGTTLEPRFGNPTPRIAECPDGMINAVGLQNPGVDAVIREELPALRRIFHKPVMANVSGFSVSDYVETVAKFEADEAASSQIGWYEINISCPNVHGGGMAFGTSAQAAAEVTAAVRRTTDKPLLLKLSPNVTDITEIARACEAAGADGISLINTLLGMRIDIEKRKPILSNVMGGLSGPAVFPVAVRMVYQVRKAVSVPILGMGGIRTGRDIVEMLLAGADAVAMGTVMFNDPTAPVKALRELEEWMDAHGVKSVSELSGAVEVG